MLKRIKVTQMYLKPPTKVKFIRTNWEGKMGARRKNNLRRKNIDE